MIPTKERIEEISNLPGEEVYATIGDPRMVMKSLTKLYSNTALATIREYSTNARDSNIAAGRSDVPIEVTLPTVLNPYFVVKDSGTGLSEEELKEVYISYGTSTKRDSNLFNGYLGYGSKSALSYTNTFTVTSVKDGLKHIAVITRKPDYSVALKIVTTQKTTERNGVQIKVPVQEHESFRRIAMDFYRFWIPGTILVDGKEPEQAVGEKIDTNLYYSTGDTSYVVMGNVGYRVANPSALFQNKRMNAISFVAYVPNGAVEFTPSREDLEYSDATKTTLQGIIDKFEKKMQKQARKEIKAATDQFEAYSKWVEWSNRLGYALFADLEWNGSKFDKTVKYSKTASLYETDTWRRQNSYQIYPNRTEVTVAEVNTSGLVITDMTAVDLNSTHKLKAREYAELKGMTKPKKIYYFWEPIDNQWIKPERIVSWKDLLAALPKKAAKKAEGSGRVKGSYDYYDENGGLSVGKPIPEEGLVFWISVQQSKGLHIYNILPHLKRMKVKGFDKQVSIVLLGENRVPKFKRENPDIKNFREFAESKVNLDGESFLSIEAKTVMALSKSSNWKNVLIKMQDDRILDPEWKQYAQLLAKESELLLDYQRAEQYAIACGMRWKFKRYEPKAADLPFSQRYPLLAHSVGWNFSYNLKEEWIAYMNDAYTRKVKTDV